MTTIAEQLTSLANTKNAIKQSIIDKGVAVADTDPFRLYADKIAQIQAGGGEWQPNPEWWDIKKILDEDTRDYAGKVGVILYNFNDVSDFELSSSGMTAVATSDGAFYTYADNGANVSHNWNTGLDKEDGNGLKTRWVIYYYTTDTTSDVFRLTNNKFGWAYNCIAYLVLRINCSAGNNFCYGQRLLEAVDNVGYTISGTNFNSFFYNCYSLQKLPDNLDTSESTNFGNFCANCYSLRSLPDNLDTSNGTIFSNFCYNCHALVKLSDNLDTSSGKNFSNFCRGCHSLLSLPDVLDTSNGTIFSNFCDNCYSLCKVPAVLDTSKGTNFNSSFYACSSLQRAPAFSMAANTTSITSKTNSPFASGSWLETVFLTLPSNTNIWLDSSNRISIESFRYIADHAPDVTATPRTLTIGTTNIGRCNSADPTIITDLNARGWTVA